MPHPEGNPFPALPGKIPASFGSCGKAISTLSYRLASKVTLLPFKSPDLERMEKVKEAPSHMTTSRCTGIVLGGPPFHLTLGIPEALTNTHAPRTKEQVQEIRL